MDEQCVSMGKAAKMLGMSIDGLRQWEANGILIPVRTLTNPRRYRIADLHALMHEDVTGIARDTRCILYARVSTKTQQEAGNLDRQRGRRTTFAAEQHWTVAALTDVTSGLNEKRRGLQHRLTLVQEKQAAIVAVEDKDRLARLGFHDLESDLHAFGVQVGVRDHEVQEDPQELVEELIALTTAFSARIYGTRGGKKMGAAVRHTMAALAQEGVSE